ncbi:putative ribonuclease H-like domain-containing protein [Rosa chinensis]|uniref:Putative ribonuclease H-like domain-containing protein n=2 Tax=Rosa chinensis TaxID=74649 RepID=A0A2P6P1F2_ROSCH|nr:putative ribonuclease H-like domain-containing protein [Rosa chinensis]
MAALARLLPFVQSAIQAEAEALRASLLIAVHQGWNDIEVESDCAMLVNALEGEMEGLSEIGRIVEDCKRYANSFLSFQFRHVYRETNGVANRLAHFASWNDLDEYWVKDTCYYSGCSLWG